MNIEQIKKHYTGRNRPFLTGVDDVQNNTLKGNQWMVELGNLFGYPSVSLVLHPDGKIFVFVVEGKKLYDATNHVAKNFDGGGIDGMTVCEAICADIAFEIENGEIVFHHERKPL